MGGIVLDLGDIQGIVVRGYRLGCARFIFVKLGSPERGQQWIRRILGEITGADDWTETPTSCLNIVFSYAGLEALGVAPESLATFPIEFQEDLAKRAALVGNTGPSGPEHWEGGLGTDDVHALLILYAQTPGAVDAEANRQRAIFAQIGGIEEISSQDAAALAGNKEHFGYQDGITKIVIEGSGQQPTQGQPTIKAGEFILGHPDQRGEAAPVPQPPELGRNGSYLVYQRLYQDVAAFRRFLAETAEEVERDEEWVAAKLMGRWRSGAPIVLAPDADAPELADEPERNDNFNFKAMDPRGFLCPRGAHIRRVHPRDELAEAEQNRHLVQRRGLPYGPVLPEGAPDDGVDRGVVGVMVNASISRQFEFMQQVWINNRKFNDLGNERDPIAGNNDGTTDMTFHRRPISKVLRGIPRFVTVKGGGYFFAPSISALEFLSGNH